MWMSLVILLAGVAAYANSFSGPFIYDDLSSIPQNPHVRELWPVGEAVSAPPNTTASGRPIVSLTLALNYATGGLKVGGYHAFNLGLHLLSALLVFGIVRRTLESAIFDHRFDSSGRWLALAVAVLWTVHPLQTDSVTYVIQRTGLLMGSFYLLTLYCAIRGWGSSHHRTWFSAAVLACALGMGSKEAMVTAPLMVLLYDRTFVTGSFASALRRHWSLYVGLGLTELFLAALLASDPRAETVGFGHGMSAWTYLKIQTQVIAWYLRLCFWPKPLIILHDWPEPAGILSWLMPGLLVLALLALTVWQLVRRWGWGFVGAWFFLILAPTSSFVPIVTEPAAERRMYLPLAAAIVLVVVGGDWVLRKAGTRRPVGRWTLAGFRGGLVVTAAALLGYGTAQRNEDYRTELAIWADALRHYPDSPDVLSAAATALFREGRFDKAVLHYSRSLELRPDHAETRYNLANALVEEGDVEGALDHYAEAVRLKPHRAELWNNSGRACFSPMR